MERRKSEIDSIVVRRALKGRRSAPLHSSRDVYSGRRRRGRVPLCHRLLCRLTFQLVVIRSSPWLGAKLSSRRATTANPTKTHGHVAAHSPFDVSPVMKRSTGGGQNLKR